MHENAFSRTQLNSELSLVQLSSTNNNKNDRKVRIKNALIKNLHTKTRCVVVQPLGFFGMLLLFYKFDNNTVTSHQETAIDKNIRTPA